MGSGEAGKAGGHSLSVRVAAHRQLGALWYVDVHQRGQRLEDSLRLQAGTRQGGAVQSGGE